MKLKLLIFIIATCSANKLTQYQRAPNNAASSGGEDYLSVVISNEYIPPEVKKTLKQYLPPVDEKQYSNEPHSNDATYSYIPAEYASYYIPPTENRQYSNEYPEVKQPSQEYLPPSEAINHQYVPQEEIKNIPNQYLLPFDTKQNSQYYTNLNSNNNYYHRSDSAPMVPVPSNMYYQNLEQSHSESDSRINQYSTHSPMISNQQNLPDNQQYEYLLPSEDEVVSILPQKKQNLPVPQATRRYDNQYQQLDTQTYTSNQTSSPLPYGYNTYSQQQQQVDNNIQNINSRQQYQQIDNTNTIPEINSRQQYQQIDNINNLPEINSRQQYQQQYDNNIPEINTHQQYQQQQQQVDNNMKDSHQQIDNGIQDSNTLQQYKKQADTAFKPYTPQTEVQNNKWMKPEVYTTTTQYPIQQNTYNQINPIENNQYIHNQQSIPYGERITPQPPLYASSRSSTPVTSPPAISEKSESIIPQQVKYIPQLPSQFKPSQPLQIETPIHHPYQQNQQKQIQQEISIIPQESMKKFPYQLPIITKPKETIKKIPYQQQTFAKMVQNTINPYVHESTTESMPILKQTSEMELDGSYNYETLTGDQTHIMQHGHIENLGTDHEEQVMQGSYSFIGDDGKTYTVNYIADANGFRATGDHLPTPPPIPDVIQRSIDFNLAEEAAAKATQRPPQGYQYPSVVDNRSYQVHEQARERSSHAYDSGYKY